ncbi:hypothetical protein PR001_g20228 [Phytophthora rubi]|uniref:Uncharacterized protein n=1 Tax=Phytophthora rubi TaxID=129364 RepID=A0A6A3JNM7_9STRA|nr:hypothetical protein PR002_g20808 [Phytophthora rubi]KAE8995028.1 hypothetical protein PR001_g20228 [Phytophthora rubi]
MVRLTLAKAVLLPSMTPRIRVCLWICIVNGLPDTAQRGHGSLWSLLVWVSRLFERHVRHSFVAETVSGLLTIRALHLGASGFDASSDVAH